MKLRKALRFCGAFYLYKKLLVFRLSILQATNNLKIYIALLARINILNLLNGETGITNNFLFYYKE